MASDRGTDEPSNLRIAEQVGFWEVDLDDMSLTLSDEACAVYGIESAACPLDDFLQSIRSDERQRVGNAIQASLRAGTRLDIEYWITHRSGEERRVRARGEPLRRHRGPARYLGTIQDVTEQLRRQREAELDAWLLQMASGVAHIGGWSCDTAQGRVIWSDEVCRIHEVPVGTVVTVEQALAYFTPESRGKLRRLVDACLRDGIPYDEELQLVTARGRSKWVRSIGEPIRGADQAITGLQGAFQDISDKRAAEQQAARMAERLSATLESITDAFYTLDREWRFTYLNREAERLFKRPRAQLLGKVLWEEFSELKGQIGYREFHRAARENRTVVFEEYYAPYQTLSEVRAYPSDEGLTVYFRDVTAQRQYAARLKALSNQLLHVQEAERARIAAELHDEMGQTVTALKLGLQSMRGAARSAGWEAKLDDNIQLAAGVLDRIRDLSLDLRPPLLGEIGLAGALDAHVRNLADITGLDIGLDAGKLQRLPPQIEIACFRLAQEALTNAIRHAEARRIKVRVFFEEGRLQLRVDDDGVGFDPDAAYQRALAGKSMGLLNMIERVKLIGGNCVIESALGQGTSVEACFPPDEATAEPVNPAAPSRPAPN